MDEPWHVIESWQPTFARLAREGQRPGQLFVTCADSRVLPNLSSGSGPGELFTVRNIGGLVPPRSSGVDTSVGACVEYAVEILGVRAITVCGHSHCGAMNALLNGGVRQGSQLEAWLDYARPSVARWREMPASAGDSTVEPDQLCRVNTIQQLDHLRTYPSVREAERAGRLRLEGMYLDVATAGLFRVDPATCALAPAGSGG